MEITLSKMVNKNQKTILRYFFPVWYIASKLAAITFLSPSLSSSPLLDFSRDEGLN